MTLVESESAFVFTTHFHDIMKIKKIRDIIGEVLVKHMTIEYDEMTDILKYERKLKEVMGNQSYGLEVCRMFQMDVDFMDVAHSVRLELQPDMNIYRDSSSCNRKLIKTNCFICGEQAVDGASPSTDADEKGRD